ncbi:unnamed protein product [Clonostachys rhizophaga]|uniref:Uncharacterized protein n=1 Tax=Clonostachys rhizophaga TaxID=160324 RepID=A0A9N9VFA2_9HYPO|nr:unnamed protein product [Clonostachys rhizophaga]
MAEEGTAIPLVMPITPYDDLHVDFNPESQIITEMMTSDEISSAITVDKIVTLTCTLAATSSGSDLDQHALNVSHTLLAIAMRVPHDKQSKLVDFCFRLRLHTTPDPINGGALSSLGQDEDLWSKWPHLEHVVKEYEWSTSVYESELSDNQIYQNYTAWRAQLYELGFFIRAEEADYTYIHLTWVLGRNYDHLKRRQSVRLMCMWFIYAPNKICLDVPFLQGSPLLSQLFGGHFWQSWRDFFKGCQELQGLGSQDLLDEDTQELIRRALENMEEVEAEHAISSGELSITQRATD